MSDFISNISSTTNAKTPLDKTSENVGSVIFQQFVGSGIVFSCNMQRNLWTHQSSLWMGLLNGEEWIFLKTKDTSVCHYSWRSKKTKVLVLVPVVMIRIIRSRVHCRWSFTGMYSRNLLIGKNSEYFQHMYIYIFLHSIKLEYKLFQLFLA